MALFDRLKDAAKPTNTIEAVQQPEPERRQEPRLAQSAPAAPGTVASEAPSPSQTPAKPAQAQAKAPAYTSEPEVISRTYYVEDRGTERRYFDDYQKKALAIRADDATINSKREDLNTIRAMLTMAEARGWSEVKVAGSAEFKREAWIEAAARGITAQGYKAGDLDRQEADRRRAERGPDAARPVPPGDGNEIRRATPQQAAPAPAQAPMQPAVEASQAQARSVKPETVAQADATQAPARQAKPADAVQPAPAVEATQARKPAPVEAEKPAPQLTAADHRKVAKEAAAALSDDGRLVFAAMSEKIDRQMNKLNADGKAEMKAFVATELVKKEKAEGPVMLTKEQRQLAIGPEPAQQQAQAAQQPAPALKPVQAPERAPEVPERAPRPARDEPEPEQPRRRRSR
jgi:hypothetical protein